MTLTPDQLKIRSLGERHVRSPLNLSNSPGDGIGDFMPDNARIVADIAFQGAEFAATHVAFERAGPREQIFFDPRQTRAAIVTCGGLCPGLNNVIRSATLELLLNYGVRSVLGIRYGYQGLNPEVGEPPIELTVDRVDDIGALGGTILGSSRGEQPAEIMLDFLKNQGIQLLICVGGDGTQRGALALEREARRRGEAIAVVGVPKTIDNDIAYVEQTFGFGTALEKAAEHIAGAHAEARGVPYGVGLVKLMGRHAGFIAVGATLASGQVNFALIPEAPFRLDGELGFLARLDKRLRARGHAVVVVAEGAGQELLAELPDEVDASGHRKLGDIGVYLKQRILEHFRPTELPVTVKYFDPSYHIRSVPANRADALLCNKLARRAVHAGMAGKTGLLIGKQNGYFTHVPLELVTSGTRRVDTEGEDWTGVLAATGQGHW
ncbi:MAG: ATP-dependent 6-phosphofructokinase [Planctomycetales bacterium]|nr:ATP-dependent 6-phosphofructokinase [Planctomycetales bacterium]